MQLLQQLVLAYLQFLAYQVLGAVGRVAQHVADGEELRLLVLDNAAVGRDVDLAVGEGIEGVDGLVRRHAGRQVDEYLHLSRCQVVYAAGLDLTLLDGLGDAFAERAHRLRERQLAYDQRLGVQLLYLSAYLEHAATLSVVVFRHVDRAARLEVGVQLEVLAVQVADGSVAYLAEVVGQNLRRQADGYALGTLRQQQGELHGQRDGLLVASVVAELPLRRLRVEHRVQGELGQTCLDISGCSGAVAGEYVTPVALRVHQQVLLSQLHQCVAYGGVAVRVKLHGVSHDVGHLVIPAVVHALHGVQYASLHGLQSVLYVRHGTFQYHIRSIVQEPVLIHAAQVVDGCCVKSVHGLIVRVSLRGCLFFCVFRDYRVFRVVFYFVIHLS